MKFSIIIPHLNGLSFLTQCVGSIYDNTTNFEIIIVDGGSDDGSIEWLKSFTLSHSNFHPVFYPQSNGFAESVNAGLCSDPRGDYVVILNNDTIVTPHWLDYLKSTFKYGEESFKTKVGAVGPVSNYAGGEQGIPVDNYPISALYENAELHHTENNNHLIHTGFLSFFCIVILKECLEDVGILDKRYKKGMWEDNDWCLRAQLKGWSLVIDQSVFIHHFGSQTFLSMKIRTDNLLRANQLVFYEKYFASPTQKLFVVSRIHNEGDNLERFLSNASRYADGIIVLADRCTDNSIEICKKYKIVKKIITDADGKDEFQQRSILIEEAKKFNADWVLSLDADEVMEDSFDHKSAHDLISPIDPQALAFGFNVKTFWNEYHDYRSDGVFGRLWGVRLWKLLPHHKPFGYGHKGLHCTHGPQLPTFNIRRVRYRILHYGYDNPFKRNTKHNFYTTIDPEPDLVKTSPQGYDHIVSPTYTLQKLDMKNDITLLMVTKDEEANLFAFLSRYSIYFDDIVIIDTGSKDNTLEIASIFKARIFKKELDYDFSKVRNFGIDQCNTAWILSMDCDEIILESHLPTLWDMIEEKVHAWLFVFENFQKNGSIILSDNVRLFRNDERIRWSWRCHENMAPSITKNKLLTLPAPFKIQHFGFLKTQGSHDHKLNLYGKMLKKQIKEYPNEPLGYFHFAFHLFEEGKEQEGLNFLNKACKLKPEFFLAHKELGLRTLQKSLNHFKHSLKYTPEAHYYHGWLKKITSTIEECLTSSME